MAISCELRQTFLDDFCVVHTFQFNAIWSGQHKDTDRETCACTMHENTGLKKIELHQIGVTEETSPSLNRSVCVLGHQAWRVQMSPVGSPLKHLMKVNPWWSESLAGRIVWQQQTQTLPSQITGEDLQTNVAPPWALSIITFPYPHLRCVLPLWRCLWMLYSKPRSEMKWFGCGKVGEFLASSHRCVYVCVMLSMIDQ